MHFAFYEIPSLIEGSSYVLQAFNYDEFTNSAEYN